MKPYYRYISVLLAVTGVAVGVCAYVMRVRPFAVWSAALLVAAVVLELALRRGVRRAAEAAAAASAKARRRARARKPSTDSTTMAATGDAVTMPAAGEDMPIPKPAELDEAPEAEPASKTEAPGLASVEPHDVVVAFAECAAPAGAVLAAHLWLEDESTSTLRLVAASGEQRPTGDPEPIAGSCLGRALLTQVPALCREMLQHLPSEERTVWRYAVPLSSGDARGVAGIDVAAEQPVRDALDAAAATLRSALTGALALHVAREQTRASNTLLEATRELSRLVDAEAVTDVLLRRAMELSSAQTGSVMLLGDDGRLTIAAQVGLPDDVALVTSMGEGEGIAGWVLATQQPVVVEDLECRGPRSRRHGIRSAVSVPISDEDGILGVLNVGNRTFRARFSNSIRDSLETLGRMGALALRTARALETSQELYFDTLKALAVALETKDPYSRGGTDRVVDLVCRLAEDLGMSEREHTAVKIAALLHDVGMSAAGDIVAVSDRPLSTVEWGLVKVHPVIAADVLEQAPALREAIPIVYHHHERYDGDGYVVGLAAQTIPLGARVLAVADAYVAMTSERPYRPAMTPAIALREMRANAGSQFDPDVVTALERIVGEGVRDVTPAE